MVKVIRLCSILFLFLCVGLIGACSSISSKEVNAAIKDKDIAEQSLTLARSLRDSGHFEAATAVYETADRKQLLTSTQALEYASVAALVKTPLESLRLYQAVETRLSNEEKLTAHEQYSLCLGMARAYLKSGQIDAAQPRFECALSAYPGSVVVLNGLGVLYGVQDEFDKSEIYFKKALSIEPTNSLVKNNLALLYLGNGETSEAIRLLRVLKNEGNKSQVLNLALAYLFDGEPNKTSLLLKENFQASQVNGVVEQLQGVVSEVEAGQSIHLALLNLSKAPMMLTENH